MVCNPLTLINATYFQNYLTRGTGAQSSPPLESTYSMGFDNFVFTGAYIGTEIAKFKKNLTSSFQTVALKLF